MLETIVMTCVLAAAGDISGSVTVTKDNAPKGDNSGAVVYLERVKLAKTDKPKQFEMKQKDKTFVPNLLVVSKGATVDFPNLDSTFHNVFSISLPAKFDLGLYEAGEPSKQITFDRTGTVNVYCNIHPDMAAVIKVVE